MTLTRYIFLIVVAFLLMIAAFQTLLIQNAQTQITEEISNKSQTLSEVALQALEQKVFVSSAEPPTQTLSIKIQAAPKEVFDLGDGYTFITGEDSQVVTVETTSAVQSKSNSRAGLVSDVGLPEVNRTSNFTYSVAFSDQNDSVSTQRIVQFDRESSSVSRYLDQLLAVTAGLTVLSIVFAYLLARHISTPLRRLSSGLTAITEGDLGKRVEERGITEVKQTLQQFNDMSERLEQAHQLEQRFQQQQQLAELGDVARGLAHSLRNPLNTIGLSLEQMSQMSTTDAERLQLAEQARKKIGHMDNSIKQLLNLANIDIKRDEALNVIEVIRDVILELSLISPIKIELASSDAVYLNGAETELRTMLHVLLSNAVEASHGGSSVAVDVTEDNKKVEVTITDEGDGIPGNLQAELFSPHVTSKAEGAGMGLFIARRIARSHYHGDIVLTNRVPKGCKATLTVSKQNPIQGGN